MRNEHRQHGRQRRWRRSSSAVSVFGFIPPSLHSFRFPWQLFASACDSSFSSFNPWFRDSSSPALLAICLPERSFLFLLVFWGLFLLLFPPLICLSQGGGGRGRLSLNDSTTIFVYWWAEEPVTVIACCKRATAFERDCRVRAAERVQCAERGRDACRNPEVKTLYILDVQIFTNFRSYL